VRVVRPAQGRYSRYCLCARIARFNFSSIMSKSVTSLPSWQSLKQFAEGEGSNLHLRELISDKSRYPSCTAEYDNIYLDFSRQRVNSKSLSLLFDLAEESNVRGKIRALASGEHVNVSEGNKPFLSITIRRFDQSTALY
jgi:glucose-6-phosphate isomerase